MMYLKLKNFFLVSFWVVCIVGGILYSLGVSEKVHNFEMYASGIAGLLSLVTILMMRKLRKIFENIFHFSPPSGSKMRRVTLPIVNQILATRARAFNEACTEENKIYMYANKFDSGEKAMASLRNATEKVKQTKSEFWDPLSIARFYGYTVKGTVNEYLGSDPSA